MQYRESMEKGKHLWYNLSSLDALQKLQVDARTGLSHAESQKRLKIYGTNTTRQQKPKSLSLIFLQQFQNPLIYLLFAAAILSFLFGGKTNPFVVIGVALLNAIMGAIQEGRAEQSLQKLKILSTLKTTALREGKECLLSSEHLVPGDIILLQAGDGVPSDARIIEAIRLQTDEASLSGESLPVAKTEGEIQGPVGITDRKNMLFAGTCVISGRAVAVVVATGEHTQFGQIALLARKHGTTKTPLEKKVDNLGKVLAFFGIGTALLLVGAASFYHFPIQEMIMAAVSLLVSVIPEGLPIAITIALAYGIQKMASRKALIRKLTAVETLGSVTTICTDKTGTLTKNSMVVKEVVLPSLEQIKAENAAYPQVQQILLPCILCNDATIHQGDRVGDPMEVALLLLAAEVGLDILQVRKDSLRETEIPFDPLHKLMATEHKGPIIYLKGAIEKILACSKELQAETKKSLLQLAEEKASCGLRILAFAQIPNAHIDISKSFEQFVNRATFLGFVALEDPLREEASTAVLECLRAGIRPIMITGDHLLTATSIARQVHIMMPEDKAMTGTELEDLSLEELKELIPHVSVFARVHPLQKLKIVEALQELGHVVAMTGDGANDAPALAKADVGVAMGLTGTDIAKQSAKMVLLDDNFATLVHAVEEGRVIFNNLQKVVYYLLSTSLSGACLLIITTLFGFPLPMTPLQLLWINVVTEGTVTLHLIMSPAEGHEMDSPPTPLKEKILSKNTIIDMLFMVPTMGLFLIGYFLWGYFHRKHLPTLQTETFTLFALCALGKASSCTYEKISSCRLSLLKNKVLIFGVLSGLCLHLAVLYIPVMNDLFSTVRLPLSKMGQLLLLSSSVFFMEELRKKIRYS